MSSDLFAGLNDPQLEAVTAGDGPVMVLAGPGSGKTRVLTNRIAYLIREMNIKPYHIMAVTFTNKAAGEMRERVERVVGMQNHRFQVGTFHSTCARILRIEAETTPYDQNYAIYDTDDQLSAVKQAMQEADINPKAASPRQILGAISAAKNEMILPQNYPRNDYRSELIARVYPIYQKILLNSNAMDFDDLLLQMALLMEDNPFVREKYQMAFQYVLVDEFQDTNMVQYQLVKQFAAPYNNVFVVGDEDQSIYGFRGADYRNVMRFREDFPEAKVILLEQNYRSTQVVLDTARAIIDHNTHRTPKALFTDRNEGNKITVEECFDEREEAQYILDQIYSLKKNYGYGYRDFAVMYRTNAQSRALEAECVNQGMPYVLVGGVGFYKRREVRDMLAYLRVVQNPNDQISFARIVNTPKRGIGDKSIKDFHKWVTDLNITYEDGLNRIIAGDPSPIATRTVNRMAEFGMMMNEFREIAVDGDLLNLFDTIKSRIGYSLYLSEISDTPQQTLDREDNLKEFRGLLAEAMDTGQGLNEFLAEQQLVSDVDSLDPDSDAITLLTLHAAKGLEYPVVFITGMEEGLLPHMRSIMEDGNVDEERRLLYVGITRAKDHLFLSYAFQRRLYSGSDINRPSSFLLDIPGNLTNGLPATLVQKQFREYRESQTTWERSTPPSRLARDLANQHTGNPKIRSKIVRFPGTQSDDDTPLKYTAGMRVRHPVYGEGKVITSERNRTGEQVLVKFNKGNIVKEFDAEFAKMDILD